MRQPATAAGRRLLADWMRGDVLNRLPQDGGLVSEQIARIEAEAAAQPAEAVALREAYVQGHRDRYRRDRAADILCLNCGKPWAIKGADAPPTAMEAIREIVDHPDWSAARMVATAESAVRAHAALANQPAPEAGEAVRLLESGLRHEFADLFSEREYALILNIAQRALQKWQRTLILATPADPVAKQPEGLDAALTEAIATFPDDEWRLLIGHEKYEPIPGSPGDVNHPGLAGRMIWWATASRRDPEPYTPLVIVSAERHDSPASALRDLAAQMRQEYGPLAATDPEATE